MSNIFQTLTKHPSSRIVFIQAQRAVGAFPEQSSPKPKLTPLAPLKKPAVGSDQSSSSSSSSSEDEDEEAAEKTRVQPARILELVSVVYMCLVGGILFSPDWLVSLVSTNQTAISITFIEIR